MGDPMAVDADMAEAIASTAERIIATRSPDGSGKTGRPNKDDETAFAIHSTDNLSVGVIIDLVDIDIDSPEKATRNGIRQPGKETHGSENADPHSTKEERIGKGKR